MSVSSLPSPESRETKWGSGENIEEKQRQEGRCVTNVVKLKGSGSRTRKRRKELTHGLPSFELRRGLPESREQVFFVVHHGRKTKKRDRGE